MVFNILKNKDRYPRMADALPDLIIVYGTREQAVALAEYLSNRYSGCDYIFYVLGEEDVI